VTLRIYTDEDTSPRLASLARASDLDIVSAHERGATRLTDEEQLSYSSAEGRVLLTCNASDFRRIARDWAERRRAHAGIILSYRQLGPSRFAAAVGGLQRIAALHDDLTNTTLALDPFIERA
jgi:hypothetical protein